MLEELQLEHKEYGKGWVEIDEPCMEFSNLLRFYYSYLNEELNFPEERTINLKVCLQHAKLEMEEDLVAKCNQQVEREAYEPTSNKIFIALGK